MGKFTYENQGEFVFVVYSPDTDEKLDKIAFGMTSQNKIPHIISPVVQIKDGVTVYKYNVSQLTVLSDYKRRVINRKQFLSLISGVIDGIEGLTYLPEFPNVRYNYGYFPIFVNEEKYGMSRDALYDKLKSQGILGRRYFYPLISTLNPYREYPSATPTNLPVATKMADQVLCLPMHHALSKEDVERIINTIRR